jgi:putative PEP-CTERM system histidine kinase
LAVPGRGFLLSSVAKTEHGTVIFGLGPSGYGLNLVFLVSLVLILMNLERTFRAAVGTMRWRIKFMVLGLAVLFAVRAYGTSQVLLTGNSSFLLQTINSAALLVACAMIIRTFSRSGHFEVNVYPSQSVLHSSVTVMLAGAYLFIVGLLAKLIGYFGGDNNFMLQAFVVLLAMVLLTMLLLSDKVRLRLRQMVSRHFQRPQYDYRTIWRVFVAGTARQVEARELCGTVTRLVSDLFQALSVTVWLVDDRKENVLFGASTSLTESRAAGLALDSGDAAMVLRAIRAHPEPVDIDASKEVWAAVVRRLQPDEFPNGGDRICVPLMAGEELMGIMILGDRVSGVPFTMQDFDLLKSAGEQAAASLLNIQLSQRLSQSKQLEAFQAMSAFFVHDLKNTASTLSLMLQNLPIHFDNPEFRADALRGIGSTVTHINDLIAQLTVLRQDISIKPAEADLNEVVNQAIAALQGTLKPELVKEQAALPKLMLDSERMKTVVTNLVLNARDAVGTNGRIEVQTSQNNGWAVLSVADNGCGMAPEFIRNSLFRAFQTTKKRGIGIGMFQCRMIVEAHGGRIEVESEKGKGTRFRVLLPVKR